MIGIIASKHMGTVKGKSKVNEPRKPKERRKKPNGPT